VRLLKVTQWVNASHSRNSDGRVRPYAAFTPDTNVWCSPDTRCIHLYPEAECRVDASVRMHQYLHEVASGLSAHADRQNLMRATLGHSFCDVVGLVLGSGLGGRWFSRAGRVYLNADLAPDNFQGTTSLRQCTWLLVQHSIITYLSLRWQTSSGL